MKTKLKCILKPFVAVILSISLTFSSAASVQVNAAALPIVYTSFDLWVTVLSLLGICAAAENLDNVDQAVEDIKSKFKVVYQDNHKGEEPDDEKWNSFLDLSQYVGSDNKLRIPQSVWEEYKKFADAITAKSIMTPSSSNNIYGINYGDYVEFLEDFLPIDSSHSAFTKFADRSHNALISSNYSGIFVRMTSGAAINPSVKNFYCFVPFSDYGYYHWNLYKSGVMQFDNRGSTLYCLSVIENLSTGACSCDGGFNTAFRATYGYEVYAFVVNGLFYNFDGVFQKPLDETSGNDYGNLVYFSDFVAPSNTISDALSSVTQSAANNLNIADVFDKGTYEIITPGRVYDPDTETVTGDVVVPLPAVEVVEQYSNGEISWADFLEQLQAKAIDTSTAKDLNTDELISTQKGILNGVNNIWNFLQSLIDALIDMLLSLFVPSEGFFEDWFSSLNDFFADTLGFLYKPFEVLFSLLNAMLNYQLTEFQLYFPGIYWQEYELCPPMYVDIDMSEEIPKLSFYMHLGTNLVMIFGFLMLVQKKYEEALTK